MTIVEVVLDGEAEKMVREAAKFVNEELTAFCYKAVMRRAILVKQEEMG